MLAEDSGVDCFLVDQEGRCDSVLGQRYAPLYSRSHCQKLIELGSVKVQGQRVAKKRQLLKCGEEVEIEFRSLAPCDLAPEAIPLSIVYEDDHLIVINKPPDLVVHPAPGNWSGTLVNALLYHCRNAPLWDQKALDELRPGIVHRLDKDTSGLIVAAKTALSHRLLTQSFAAREVEKRYLALCIGNPGARTIEGSIGRHPKERQKMAILQQGGKPALTECTTLHTAYQLSAVEALLHTGRTHQLRVHLQSIGCPILGDATYGNRSYNERFNIKRQLLHAWKLSFIHPLSQQKLSFTAQPPDDLVLAFHTHLNLTLKNLEALSLRSP